jgi:LmbE family N-acetylglucosaminyl deacetylase
MRNVKIDGDPARVLVVTAHPDDLDFGAGGTIATWTAAGTHVTYCIATDGDAGGFDPAVPRCEIPTIRRAEQRAAGAILGVTDIHFLGYRDGQLAVSHELRRDITRVIRQVRPQLVLTLSPERDWSHISASHPDHLAAGEATVQAIYPDARNPFEHPSLLADEGLSEWAVPQLWMFGSPTPNTFVDVTEQFPRKLEAMAAHVSQTAHMGGALEARMRARMSDVAARAGLAQGRLAEAFHAVDTA